MNWNWIVVVICCLLAVFAVWKEYQRPGKSNLVLRITASLIAIAALACIAIPLNYTRDITDADEHSAILLTPGFTKDSLGNYKNSKIFTADKGIANVYPKAKLTRLDELKADSPAITKLHVFGYGLNEDELKELDHLPVNFHSSVPIEGFSSIGWNQELKTGEALNVQGEYKNYHSTPIKLVLKGLNTPLDTVTIGPKKTSYFELSAVPRNEGRAVYHLLAIAGADTLSNEPLPIEINPIKPLKILMLSASPDFETRFLKNWLSENGFSVAVRSAISKDKLSSEYVNMQPVNVDHLNSNLLDKFDVVIGDLSVLKPEGALLKQQMAEKGLGVIIRADSASKTASWLQNDFPVERLNVKNAPPVPLIVNGKKGKTSALKIDPNYIKPQPDTQPLVSDEQRHVLVNTSLVGAGRLVFTTVNNTYNWMLNGDKDDYAAFWSLLIGKVARKVPVTENWSVGSSFPVADDPVQLKLETSSIPGNVVAENLVIASSQNPLIPFEWGNTFWPETAGWQSVKQNNGYLAWWYVYDKNDWISVKASEKIRATSQYAESFAANASVTKAIQKKIQIEVSKIYFYLLLLAACTFLWIEAKSAPPNPPREGGL